MVRDSVPRQRYCQRTWGETRPWWGPGRDRSTVEIDLIAESTDGAVLLLGEIKWTEKPDLNRLSAAILRKPENLPLTKGK